MADSGAPARHLPDDLLVAHAAGQLPPSRRIIVEAHLAYCEQCRRRLGDLSAPGGALLAIDSADSMAGWDALESSLDALEPDDEAPPFGPAPALPPGLRGHLPSQLYDRPWRRIPLSTARFVAVDSETDTDTSLLLLCLGPKRHFPRHRHAGVEDVVVLTGAFRDQTGRYGPGDYQQSQPGTVHRPAVEAGDPCWILTRFEGGVRFTGLRGAVQRAFSRS